MSLRKIAIVGPESTGKSLLSEQLAKHYKTHWVPEFAREYLNSLGREYVYDDLTIIARQQLVNEDKAASSSDNFLFCDTNLIVIKVWSDFKFGRTEPWIIEEIKRRKYDLHLLCDIDLPWQDDPLREHPHQRKELFDIYANELETFGLNHKVVSGVDKVRLENAIKTIQHQLKL